MKFTKIKIADKVTLIYELQVSDTDTKTVKLESIDVPTDEFRQSMAALVPSVIQICELWEDYMAGMTVQSISLRYNESDEMGAVITALKTLDGTTSPVVINTPYLSAYIGALTLPSSCVMAIEELIVQATKYLNGERLFTQEKLPLENQVTDPDAIKPAPDPKPTIYPINKNKKGK